jgi:uncharacterized membrane protein YdjX (TVP38/TMEM64 family)
VDSPITSPKGSTLRGLIKEPFVRQGAALLLAVVVLVFVASSDQLHGLIKAAVEWSQPTIAERSGLGMLLFVLLSALSAMLAFFSSAIFVPLALNSWGQPITVVLLWLGWILGGLFSYLVGRYPGRHFLRWLSPKKAERLEEGFLKNAKFPLVLIFQMALPSEVPGYLLGALRYSVLKYLLALGLTEIPFVLGTVYLGEGFLRRDYVLLIVVGVIGVLFSSTVTYLLYKKMKTKPSDLQRDEAL